MTPTSRSLSGVVSPPKKMSRSSRPHGKVMEEKTRKTRSKSITVCVCLSSLDPRPPFCEELPGTHCTCLNVHVDHSPKSRESGYISKPIFVLSKPVCIRSLLEESNPVATAFKQSLDLHVYMHLNSSHTARNSRIHKPTKT